MIKKGKKLKKGNYKGKIQSIILKAKNVYEIKIVSSVENILAGQFISILCPNHTFRRPFSVADFENNIITILMKLQGDGTKYLSSLKAGDDIEFLAPLGNSFEILNKKSLLVGAGIGIAPMLFLKKELNKNNIENYLITGFKEQDEVISGSDEVKIGGSVLDRLDDIIKENNIEVIYSCGPYPVLKGVSEIAKKYNIASYVAMERVMACSIGVCRGCTIELIRNGNIERASVCKDGSIFRGDEVVWE